MPARYPPDDPREWLNRAHSDLALARAARERVYLEDLCFHAQQAAEKAIKAVLITRGVQFAYVHDIAELLRELEQAGQDVPPDIRQAARLTRFAVFSRYPSPSPSVRSEEWEDAVVSAERVVGWADSLVGPETP